ncbi:glycosyltransferase [Paenibacillus spiritus]|uniref:Glycosyltransferase n=1 Tax=Paenibacillus spiritus TaxID=2496557 RepID=A0A5J5FW16_9BACL|nr:MULTISPECIES: glycosyltransferase [Paenibacillus]KAA8997972.1 glycosyltransferase [Paenibacillus spiritus]
MDVVNPYKVSVIIPIYNMESYLEECLDSVVNQTLAPIQIVAVNDGSTDRSLIILERYATLYPNIFIINQKNQGVSKARNRALEASTAEYIAFMDPDDYYPDNQVLERLFNKAVEHKAEICAGSYCYWVNDHRLTDFSGPFSALTFPFEGMITFSEYQFPYGFQRFMYKRDLLVRNGLLFPLYERCEDLPFSTQALVLAEQFYAIPEFVYCYRVRHKYTTLNLRKTTDCARGALDLIRVAEQEGLCHLYNLAVRIFYDDLYRAFYKFIQKQLPKTHELHELLNEIDQSIHFDWLTEENQDYYNRYPLKPHQIKQYAAKMPEIQEKLVKRLRENQPVIIYGAGVMGEKAAAFLKGYPEVEVIGAAVTKLGSGKRYITTIPVKQIEDYLYLKEKATVLIATFSNLHNEIKLHLEYLGFQHQIYLNSLEFQLFGIDRNSVIQV